MSNVTEEMDEVADAVAKAMLRVSREIEPVYRAVGQGIGASANEFIKALDPDLFHSEEQRFELTLAYVSNLSSNVKPG